MILICFMCHRDFERGITSGPVPQYCDACQRLRAKAALRRYRARNRENLKTKLRDYYHENKEKEVARNRKYRLSNNSSLLEKSRINMRTNRPRYSTYEQKRRAILQGALGVYNESEFEALCSMSDNRCVACGQKLKLTVDHVVPLSKGGENHVYNLQPLCFSCNASKCQRTIDYRPTAAMGIYLKELSKLGIDATVSALQ